jgi:hypothetical protein
MHSLRALLLTIFICAGVLAAACGGSKSCAQGTEQCACYGNATCNPGLSCLSNTCVSAGGAGGTSGAAGTAGTGATAGANAGGSGGTSSGGTGGTSAAGTGGAATGGSGGAGTGGGAGSCAANTSTDPKNCGACGHVCKNADPGFNGSCPPTGCCAGGSCGPAFSSCFTQTDVTTCAAYCVSLGETCVEDGCPLGGLTWAGWGSKNACMLFANPPEAMSRGACNQAITFDLTTVQVRCCCTDTH